MSLPASVVVVGSTASAAGAADAAASSVADEVVPGAGVGDVSVAGDSSPSPVTIRLPSATAVTRASAASTCQRRGRRRPTPANRPDGATAGIATVRVAAVRVATAGPRAGVVGSADDAGKVAGGVVGGAAGAGCGTLRFSG